MAFPDRFNRSDYAQAAQQAAAVIKRGEAKPLTPTPRIRKAIEAMVFQGLKRPEAATSVGLTDHALRTALTKPHVLALMNEQIEVLRTGARPQALRKIIEHADSAASERVSLEAAMYLDGMDRNASTIGAQQVNVQINNSVHVDRAGYVIDLSAHPSQQQIDHLARHEAKPLEDNEDVPTDE